MQEAKEAQLYLVLGCCGRVDNKFVTCPSVNNPILHIHKELDEYNELVKYLRTVQIFNRKIIDYNAVRNVLFRIQSNFLHKCRPLWDDKRFRLMENFTIQHRPCGTYLSLELLNEVPIVPEREVIIHPSNI